MEHVREAMLDSMQPVTQHGTSAADRHGVTEGVFKKPCWGHMTGVNEQWQFCSRLA